MKINADEVTVEALLSKANVTFRVPVYQRPYSWGYDQYLGNWSY